MNKILKKPYEISLWKEVPMYVIKEGNSEPRITDTLPIEGTYILLNEFKEEICEAVIGSNTMSTPIKAFNSKLTQQLNGTNSLSFDILYKYLDERTGEYKKNPFTNLLVNERIVKLKYDEEWFFFVIKGIQENSSNFTFNYTCNDLYINELSKTGYNIELNTELRNNQGTIINLAEFILEDSDWKVDNESELIKQKNKESLYTYKIEENEGMESFVMDDFTFNIFKYPEMKSLIDGALSNTNNLDKFVDNGVEYLVKKGFVYTVQQNETIFIPYSSITNKENPIQFFYYPPCVDSNTAADDYIVDSIDGIILNSPNWMVSVDEAFFDKELKITTTLFGEKLVSMQESKYIVEIDNICSVYEKDEEEYYCLRKTEYSSVTEITNLLSNNSNFITLNGWNSVPATAGANSSVILSYINSGNSVEKTLKVNFGDSGKVINSGIYNNRKATNGFIEGEEYIFAVKAENVNNITGAKIATPTKDFFNFYKDTTRTNIPNTLDDYTIFKATCSESLSYTDLLELDVDFYLEGQGTVDLINVKLHKLITGADGKVIIPDLEDSINSIIKFRNYFFKRSLIDHEARQTIFSESDLTYTAALYDDVLASSGFEPVFSERYEKIRSISMEKSNRFNLIQELCETFECWAQFNIECDNTGKILYSYDITNDGFPQEGKTYYLGNGTSDIDFKIALEENFNGEEDALEFKSALVYYERNYNKTILFKEFIGEDNPVGFRYGINVQSIKRDIKSDQITTKLIVEPNANEFAENGSCTIQTSVLNPTGETFLYNFDYYIRQRLISEEALYKDLYGDGIGLYPKLKKLNTLNINDINELVLIKTTIDRLKSRKSTYENLIIAAEEQVEEADKEILKALNNPIKEEASAKVGSSEGRLTLSLNGNTVNWSMSNLQHLFNTTFYIKAGISSDRVAKPSSSVSSISVTNPPAENSSSSTSGSFTISTSQAGRFWYYGYAQTKDSNYWPVDRGSIVVTGETESLDTDYIDRWTTIRNEALNIIENYKDILYNIIELFNQYIKRMESLDIILAKREKQTASLIKEFYKRYSRFIQEGVWTSEDYIDSELYYLDAQKVLYTSSSPQISYSIDVVELSQLEKFKPYSFKVGDKTYIEDTEFFGWDIETDMPYQEEIIVSEVTFSLDNPSQNSIKVQNYKTQFEDLFQRIAATTQSLQYAEGKYKRAASAINSDGTIKSSLLENSLEQNSLILQNAANQSVTWDETGITISDEVNPNEIVRLVSGGIVLTVDGGKKWTTGVTGKGINANVITTGRLDTDKIRVFAGESPSFEWDGVDGISAYMFGYPGEPIDRGRFVRFNKYGLFGFNGDTTTEFNTINDVIDNSEFSLTWRGLKINIQDKTSATEVININDGNFLVRGDGSIIANEGYFKGEIVATGGTFEGIVKAQEFQIKDEYGNYVNILDDSKIGSKYLDLGNIKLDGETGDIELVGNINFSGGNITWGQTNSPVQYKFAPLQTTPDDLWSDTMRETDKFRKDSLNGGESWGAPYQFRAEDGEDGEPGSNGSNGRDATVNFTNVNNILKNYFGIDGGSTSINESTLYSPTIYAGRIYAGVGKGQFSEMTQNGLNVYYNSSTPLIGMGCSGTTSGLPFITFGVGVDSYGTDKGMIKKFTNGIWIGDNDSQNSSSINGTGIFVNFSTGKLFGYVNGTPSELGSGTGGTAVFG